MRLRPVTRAEIEAGANRLLYRGCDPKHAGAAAEDVLRAARCAEALQQSERAAAALTILENPCGEIDASHWSDLGSEQSQHTARARFDFVGAAPSRVLMFTEDQVSVLLAALEHLSPRSSASHARSPAVQSASAVSVDPTGGAAPGRGAAGGCASNLSEAA